MKRCAITDGSAASRPAWMVARCAQLADQGVDLILIRERHLEPSALVHFARRVVEQTAGTRVLLAGSPLLALAAGVAGVHLSARPEELTPAQVRAAMPAAYITQSCHTLDEVRHARDHAVDAALFGPVFGKWVGGAQVVDGLGLEQLAQAVAAAGPMPVFALGGITQANAAQCSSAGIAAIRMFFA